MKTTDNSKTKNESHPPNFFAGSIPHNYDNYMGPVLFTPYALDITARMNMFNGMKILELAAGTGRVTKEMVAVLPDTSHLLATDISAGMLAIAQENVTAANVSWAIADMANIPCEAEQFDIIVCQFGLMFVPDKPKALSEMYRVLKTGGQLLFNTWGDLDENPVWKMSFATLYSFLGSLPFAKDAGPFALIEKEPVCTMMREAGFTDVVAEEVRKISDISTADVAAESFLMTSPVMEKAPDLYNQIHKALSKKMEENFGTNPLHAPMLALVFEAKK